MCSRVKLVSRHRVNSNHKTAVVKGEGRHMSRRDCVASAALYTLLVHYIMAIARVEQLINDVATVCPSHPLNAKPVPLLSQSPGPK